MIQVEEVRNRRVFRLCLHPDSVYLHMNLLVPSPEPITSGEDTEKEDMVPGQGSLLREHFRRNSTGRGEQGSWDRWCAEGRPPGGKETGVEP